MYGFQWYLKFYPNGNNVYKAGNVGVCVAIAALSSKLEFVKISRDLKLVDTTTTNGADSTYYEDNMS